MCSNPKSDNGFRGYAFGCQFYIIHGPGQLQGTKRKRGAAALWPGEGKEFEVIEEDLGWEPEYPGEQGWVNGTWVKVVESTAS